MTPPRLRTLVVAADPAAASFADRVLRDHGDEVTIAVDVPDALAQLTRSEHQLALVSLSLPRGDGLALVHHIRALHPDVDVVVMTAPSELADTAHALALGVLQSVMLPLTGDALLVAADRCRERRILVEERKRLAAEGELSQKRTATYARCAAFVAETDPTVVGARVLDACVAECSASTGALYAPAYLGANDYARVATHGERTRFPGVLTQEELLELDPTRAVVVERERRADVTRDVVRVALMGTAELDAVLLLECERVDTAGLAGLEVIAGLGTAAMTAARRVDAIARSGIKDPETSAYTFAYFGDVAGREIDRAARHQRRFSLLIVNLDGVEAARPQLDPETLLDFRRLLSDALLETVRDSDVLARVEDDEYYVLLPETGLLGALAAKRRIESRFNELTELARFQAASGVDPVVGIAVFPSDGGDLGRLLRVGRRRAEQSRAGVFRRMGLARMPFWEAIDLLLGDPADVTFPPEGGVKLHEDLERNHDAQGLAQHVVLPRELLPRVARTLIGDATRHRAVGTLYAAGDPGMVAALADAVGAEPSTVRAWVLGGEAGAPGSELRLPVADERLREGVVLLALSEIGGYMLVGRSLPNGSLLAYHAADLDLVDGLITALQAAYHLQPEVRV
ncbi:MAG: response regulator [Sandaracinaceae bacterium]|nr:response regulator [Myxococcales bacterium]MCB9656540.1 response regulator [Sandaracinaceae bacterium]